MKDKINKVTSKVRNSKAYNFVSKNKKKVVGVTLSVFMVFIFTFTMYNLNNPTYFNKLFASIGENPANEAFKDKAFYNCVVNAYNSQNSASKAYTDSLTDEELKSIKELECSWEYVEDTSGVEKLTGLTKLNLEGNKLKSIDLSKNIALTDLNLHSNKLKSIDLSRNTELIKLDLYDNPFIYDIILQIGDTYEIDDSNIILPEGKSITYSIDNYSSIVKIDGKKVTALSEGNTRISFYVDNYNVNEYYQSSIFYLDLVVGKSKYLLTDEDIYFERIYDEEKFILLMNVNEAKKLTEENFSSRFGDIVLKDNKLEIVRDNKVIATYNIGILDVSGFLDDYERSGQSGDAQGNFIITVNDVNDVKEPIINTTNCEYEYKDNKINVIYNGKVIDSFNLINIYADKKYLIRYNYENSDFMEFTLFTENFDESLINNITDIKDINKDKINILNAEFEYVEDPDEEYINGERMLNINVDGKYVGLIQMHSFLSNNYDLTKDYIYLGNKKFNNDIYMKGINIVATAEELNKYGLINVSEDSISFWDNNYEYDPTNEKADEDGDVYLPYKKLKEWKFIKVTSEEYEISEDKINLNYKDENIDLSKINVTNALLKVENDKLLVKYNDEVVKELSIVNKKVNNATKVTTTTKKETTTKKKSTTSSNNIESTTTNTKQSTVKKTTIKTTTKVEENNISNKIKNGIRLLKCTYKPMIILLGLISIILLIYIIILLNKKDKEEEK